MNLTDLKTKPIPELLEIAHEMGMDNLGRSRKQEIIASVLRKHAKGGEAIYGDGTLEILQDGFGFLRSADSSYLAGPDDIYVSPSQIRRFNLRTGDSVSGKIRPPKVRTFDAEVHHIDPAPSGAGRDGPIPGNSSPPSRDSISPEGRSNVLRTNGAPQRPG